MVAEGHQVTSLHGAKDAMERDRIIDAFREGKSKVLITTNVAARGLDISQVNMVINYDMPQDVHGKPDWETYLHRVGKYLTACSLSLLTSSSKVARGDSGAWALQSTSCTTKRPGRTCELWKKRWA